MIRQFSSTILFLVILSLAAAQPAAAQTNDVRSAREVITLMDKGEFKEITSMFDSTMKKAAPEERLRAIWTSLIGQTGELQQQLNDSTFQYGGYDIVIVTCKFQKSYLDVKVVFDKGGKVAGLFFLPHRTPEGGDTSGPTNGQQSGDSLTGHYVSQDVAFENEEAHITLAGTLTIPDSVGKFPAVLLIAGSGPHDRDETIFGHKPFLVLADYLTRHGIAVLRYDKRGVGKSTGDYAAATTTDFASDALAGVDYLMTLKAVDHGKIGLVGHSEGGMIAPVVADKSNHVAFIVLMAGPGVSGYRTILSQLALIDKASGLSDSAVAAAVSLEKKILRVVMTEKDSARAAATLRNILETEANQTPDAAEASIGQLLSPWYESFLAYDPAPALRKVKCPVLAIWGSKDLQVPPSENMPAMRKALKSGGNKSFKVVELQGLNHLFQDAQTGSPLEYGIIKETISPKALDVITNWILKETGKKN